MRRWIHLSLFLWMPVSSAVAAVDFTGTWNGTLSAVKLCRVTGTFTQTAAAAAYFVQTGTSVSGSFVVEAPVLNVQCQPAGSLTIVVPLGGAVTNAVFATPVVVLGTPAQFTAKITNGVMGVDLKIVLENSDISGTLTRTTSQPPASDFSGTYSGTFTSTILPCSKPPSATFSGSLTLNLLQAGPTLAGSGTFTGGKSDKQDATGKCTIVDDPPTAAQLSALVSGNQITGFILDAGGASTPFSGTMNGSTFTGSKTNQ